MAGMELERPGGTVVIPLTGEAIDLADANTDDLADAIDRIRDLESQLRSAKRQLAHEAVARMDAACQWTLAGADLKLSAPSPGRVEWDADRLARVLAQMVVDGRVPREAAELAVVAEPKVKVAGLNALLKRPDLREELEECSHPSDAPRNVKLTRKGSS